MKRNALIKGFKITLVLALISIQAKGSVISFCGKNEGKKIIVVGSMHSAREARQPKNEMISAIKSSSHVLLEADISASAVKRYLDVVNNIDRIKLSSENQEALVRFFKENENLRVYNLNLERAPSHVISNLIPLARNNQADTAYKWSYDARVKAEAEKSKIDVSFLEDENLTLNEWVKIGAEDINKILSSQIEFYSNKENSFNNEKEMMLAWESGDEDKMRGLVLEQYPGKAKALIQQRHSKREELMAEKIDAAVGSQVFVVVGAYHVNYLRTLLKNKGYKSFNCNF